ncbi:MAG TPA: outer membrane protein assembly factor BamD [Candidatus Koribacter sp.]|jgi:outer membrane protein assembly factor BamD
MYRRALIMMLVGMALVGATACKNKKVTNPIANVDSKQPDKVLFDRAMDAMKHSHFDVARVTLQTLINTYPDSEYIARAKLAIGDSWYAEGGSAAMAQAENEYKDFQTFFPNMAEAAEAQMKIANIHYSEMEKPDRDYTHAKRAEEEYRQMILQYPDSKLIPQAKQRLREVQEILADREYRIGRFYFLREDYPASIARLQTMSDTYPLYSGADETLFLIGQCYQAEAEAVRRVPTVAPGKRGVTETQKAALIENYEKNAANAYAKIVTRYPAMPRAEAARKKLADMHMPVPTPTPEALAQNKAEEQSRGHQSRSQEVMGFLNHHPDTTEAAKVGEPQMIDPPQTNPVKLVQQANAALLNKPAAKPAAGTNNGLTLEPVGAGAPPPSEPLPRSDSGATNPETAAPVETGTPTPTAPSTSGGTSSTTDANNASAGTASTNDANTAPAPAPARVNDAATPPADSSSGTSTSGQTNAQPDAKSGSSSDSNTTNSQDSTSKKKKKKGLAKLNPF